MNSDEIRKRFINFFQAKGHTIVPSSSLVPENDSSVLFTTAGMQQFKPYYLGEKSPYGQNVVSVQKCVRTGDIDEVGDDTHLTFFEMLGNFSFGGYWKKEAIAYAHEFITKELGLTIDYVSVFKDDESGIPADEESRKIWQEIDSTLTIKDHNRSDNFWGPTGVKGVKSGLTDKAGQSLVTFVDRDHHSILLAVLGSQDRFADTSRLIEWLYANFDWVAPGSLDLQR
jgi:alanyl-tRNA synthetase